MHFSFAQQNFDLSTLRIGAFTINMKKNEVEKNTKSKINISDNDNDYYKPNKINYLGEAIEIIVAQDYDDNGKTLAGYKIYGISTKSKKFRTKSGLGVGSTKEQLLQTYKNYPNFSMNQMWDEKSDKPSKTKSAFNLQDNDASTILSFKMENNIVTEVNVSMNEGC